MRPLKVTTPEPRPSSRACRTPRASSTACSEGAKARLASSTWPGGSAGHGHGSAARHQRQARAAMVEPIW